MSTMTYAEFLASKQVIATTVGIEVEAAALHPVLYEFQRQITRWALRKGRAAIFADAGLGKTLMQLEWARQIADRALILAPLAVAQQTVQEGERWGIPVVYARNQADSPARGITIANYEMVGHFDIDQFGAVVLDESSILKAHDGKTRARLIELFRATPYRLCCTATPAPNDIAELANHAEFLGLMSRAEMLATFFVHDDAGWRLKGHARDAFYRWLASWGMSVKRPSDLGYPDDGYDLPALDISATILPVDYTPPGQLFFTALKGVVRHATLDARVAAAADLINADPSEPWLAWVGLNDEGRELAKRVPDAVLVEGADSPDAKAAALTGFADGAHRILISKPTIAGFGMNFQHCARMVFVGLGDSYEQYYQAIRRCWRFGQTRPVDAHIVLTDPEEAIYANVRRKEAEAEALGRELVRHVADFERAELAHQSARETYHPTVPMQLPRWMERAA